ncbi:hypothetical protein SMD44_08377 [Streptomyces alboflavus]|uniref:L,D-TPase catalytic domain-containing protein n=1 Tax=Streptomyces alboflavus TaxID=67267 RepID=A0A1Z1WR54_9ACTN|nr:hypothetical protein SMD44_08377 [Streptomyces alboflavus]
MPGQTRAAIACVDLTRQLSWIQDGKTLKLRAGAGAHGRNGHETRTGLKKVYWRDIDHISSIYHVPMPYSQFFDGGQAFHSVGISVWSPPGSHGA